MKDLMSARMIRTTTPGRLDGIIENCIAEMERECVSLLLLTFINLQFLASEVQ